MRRFTIENVKDFLFNRGISSQMENDKSVRIKRDDIVANINGAHEEDSYQNLIEQLREQFKYRFYYTMKNDDYLWLDTVTGE